MRRIQGYLEGLRLFEFFEVIWGKMPQKILRVCNLFWLEVSAGFASEVPGSSEEYREIREEEKMKLRLKNTDL